MTFTLLDLLIGYFFLGLFSMIFLWIIEVNEYRKEFPDEKNIKLYVKSLGKGMLYIPIWPSIVSVWFYERYVR